MLKRIVCYGDSNTYGYDATDLFGGRLPEDQRWPELLASSLRCDVINCGMNGRTVARYPRSVENDLRLIGRALPCDLLVILLGTNDILLDREPEETAEAMTRFLRVLKQRNPQCEILLCAPSRMKGIGSVYQDAILLLAELYEEIARTMDIRYLNTSIWPIELAADGIHFSPEGHRLFAKKIESAVCTALE